MMTASLAEEIPGVTGVILAGGSSSRMMTNKALLSYDGESFISRIHRRLCAIFPEVIVVTNTPLLYDFLPCRKVGDLYPGSGSLAGIHAGLTHSATPYVFVVACDMPFLNEGLIRHLAARAGEGDVVIPESDAGMEPLHAVYGKGCLGAMEENLAARRYRIIDCFDRLSVSVVRRDEVARIDPRFLSFRNVNTPQEYAELSRALAR